MEVTGKWLKEHYNEMFKKYSDKELIKDINNFKLGDGLLFKFLSHFFKEEIFKCRRVNRGEFTPMDFLNRDDLLQTIIEYCNNKPNFYTGDEVNNVDRWLSNSTRYTRRVSNFPTKEAQRLILNYFPNYNDIFYTGGRLNVLDPSTGFGSRLCASVLSDCNYYSTDPNEQLHKKICESVEFLRSNKCIPKDLIIDTRCCGSEIHLPQWDNIMDVCFTSPPYFNLEEYSKDQSSSTTNYNNYDKWLELYVKPTIDNIYRYLKIGGYAIINIKNLDCKGKEPLFDDWVKLFEKQGGFKRLPNLSLSINPLSFNQLTDNYKGDSEDIMSFQKIK